eukprot:4055357-Amphidinium_carterae.1
MIPNGLCRLVLQKAQALGFLVCYSVEFMLQNARLCNPRLTLWPWGLSATRVKLGKRSTKQSTAMCKDLCSSRLLSSRSRPERALHAQLRDPEHPCLPSAWQPRWHPDPLAIR